MIFQIICLAWLTLFDVLYSYEVVTAYNCGSQNNITTKYVKYQSDEMYEGASSRMALKPSLPPTIVDEEDKQLLISERVTDYDSFSYFFKISSRGRYVLVLKFIEVVHKARDERVFNIKIGDQIIHRVDIFAEASQGSVLHKWVFFDLKEDIVYLNKTYPALNAYIFTKRLLKVTIQKVKGIPKIDAIILVKGDDSEKFLNDFISYEQSKNTIVRQYVSEKYHKIPKNRYRSMKGRENYLDTDEGFAQKTFQKYFWKLISSIIAVSLLIFNERIYWKANDLLVGKSSEGESTSKQKKE